MHKLTLSLLLYTSCIIFLFRLCITHKQIGCYLCLINRNLNLQICEAPMTNRVPCAVLVGDQWVYGCWGALHRCWSSQVIIKKLINKSNKSHTCLHGKDFLLHYSTKLLRSKSFMDWCAETFWWVTGCVIATPVWRNNCVLLIFVVGGQTLKRKNLLWYMYVCCSLEYLQVYFSLHLSLYVCCSLVYLQVYFPCICLCVCLWWTRGHTHWKCRWMLYLSNWHEPRWVFFKITCTQFSALLLLVVPYFLKLGKSFC